MKRSSVVETVVSLAVVTAISLAGCGGDSSSGITGPWRFTNLSAVQETITFNQNGNVLTGSTDAGGTVSGIISQDNSVRVAVTYSNTVVDLVLVWDGANQMIGTATDLENNSIQVQLDMQQTGDAGVQETPTLQGVLVGSWQGTCEFAGAVGGRFTMTIDAQGNVTGTYTGSSAGTINGTVSGLGSFSSLGSGAGTDDLAWSGVIQRVDANSIRGSGTWSGMDWFDGDCTGQWSSDNW